MPETTDTPALPTRRAADNVLGQYTLVREVGRGGMSVVHEARHAPTGRAVALKVLAVPPGLTPQQSLDMRARFEREAHAVVGLSHPNIVSIYELGEQDGQPFLVMEYLRGETLRQRLAGGPLAPAQALFVLRQVADAVDAVHALGVVHRDIKPSNVMLLADGTAKLLDFGVARQSDDATITHTGALVGSPAYMAPEQVRGEGAAPASDLWALGVLLYEMLAGRPPFAGKNIPSVLYQVSHESPPPVAGLSGPVQRVLRRALDKSPARRYPTARALAESLAAAVPVPRSRRPWAGLAPLAGVTLGAALLALLLGPHLVKAPPVQPAPRAGVSPVVGPESDRSLAPPPATPPPPRRPHPRRRGVKRRRAARPHPATGHQAARPQRPAAHRLLGRPPAAAHPSAHRRPAPAHHPPRAATPHRPRAAARVSVPQRVLARGPVPVDAIPDVQQFPARHRRAADHAHNNAADAFERLQKYIYPVGH